MSTRNNRKVGEERGLITRATTKTWVMGPQVDLLGRHVQLISAKTKL